MDKVTRQLNRILRRHPRPLEWTLTLWKMDGKGGWKQQPVILIEGQPPFYADHPQPYIDRLEEMAKAPMLLKGPFHTLIGQLKDALEQSWDTRKKR